MAYNTGFFPLQFAERPQPGNTRMNQPELATCHCIISHPSKPKFLVIKHSDRWAPPTVGIRAAGPLSTKAKIITDGVQQKYGLKTRVLRHWVSLPGYHCVELEMPSPVATRKLQAVWVGSKEYAEYRSSVPGTFDPFEAWLKQAEAGGPGAQRPWERAGWFDGAANWMLHELDRSGIQVTGSVEQFMAFRLASCVLRVRTAEGDMYLKASLPQQPFESTLTRVVASRWPDWVPAPLAVDERQNWMLSRDYEGAGMQLQFADYPSIARAVATLQVESMSSLQDWRALGCPAVGPGELSAFAEAPGRLSEILGKGGDNALSEQELNRLLQLTGGWKAAGQSLADLPLPNALLHSDLWYPNLYRREGGFWITDWSGAMIGHPFFSVLKLLRFRALWQGAQAPLPDSDEACASLTEAIVSEYLEPFSSLDTAERLREALALVRQLEGPWRLLKWARAIDLEELGGFHYQRIARTMRRIARQLIE